MQRVGKTAPSSRPGGAGLDSAMPTLFEVVGKDEFCLRIIERWLQRPQSPAPGRTSCWRSESRPSGPATTARGGVLVVGVESLTTLARCRPAPPDVIGGYVTRGKGVAIHRADCATSRDGGVRRSGSSRSSWGKPAHDGAACTRSTSVEAIDRQGLLRDISEVFAKEDERDRRADAVGARHAWMTFTVEIADSPRLGKVLAVVRRRERRALGAAALRRPCAATIAASNDRRVAQLVRAPP